MLLLSSRDAKLSMVDPRDAVAVVRPGAFYFMRKDGAGDPVGIIHACPCGCGQRYMIFFRGRGPGPQHGYPEWDIVGEWPKATAVQPITLLPFLRNGRHHWVGRLRKGVFVEG